MKILTIDFETRWDSKEYTLSKMTTEEYIRHEKFKAFGACIHEYGSDDPIVWVRGDDLPEYFSGIEWGRTAVLAHNAQFDVSILEWRYNAHPAIIFDTLSMARALRGLEVGNSLARLADDFGLPAKGTAVYSTDGVAELDANMESELAEYCKHDVYLCERIFERLGAGYPKSELKLIDMTLKMYTRACLELDQEMLEQALAEERTNRIALLRRLKIEEKALASNPQFAAALESIGVAAPYKTSKTTGKQTLALAKNDALFQALLNGPYENVALLCEARLKVKSTTERTRAQRFLDISQRGTLPVPLSYYGAATGRWTASKGSAINMQNLKRGSFLRKAIMAPEGYVLAVADLSQIEPRVLAWMSGYDGLLNVFRAGGDPYAAFGSQMFGIPGMTKDSHPVERQSAKSALLGCFGSQTPVLTKRGWVTIVEVRSTDLLWDGEEWVQHYGVVPQGEKEVLTAHGVSATSDHEILTEHGWVEWSEVLANHSRLQSALSLASSHVLDGRGALAGQSGTESTPTNQKCAALVGGRVLSTAPIYAADVQQGVIAALRKRLQRLGWIVRGISQSAPTRGIGRGYKTVLAQSSLDVRTRITQFIRTTAGAVLQYTLLGLQTALNSYATLLVSMGGINPSFSLIGLTTNRAMFRATLDLSRAASTCPTNARSKQEMLKRSNKESSVLRQKMQTYDIAYAGPRNRYTILTEAGPLIVHNCGYGLGWASFAAQLLVGFLGAPPLRYTKADAKVLGVTQRDVERFLSWEDNIEKMGRIPHTCTESELLIHCLAAKAIIDKYRSTATPVVDFWNMNANLIQSSLFEGKEYEFKCITYRKEEIVLPSGMSLKYPDLRQEPDKETGKMQWTYGKDRTKLYAGKLTNNIIQGCARVVMTDGMLRIAKRHFVAGTVHDEAIAVVPEATAAQEYEWMLEQMVMEPKYMQGIPLAADGGFHKRYGLAKN